MATFAEADSLVPAAAPPRILPQSSASKTRADNNRLFRFAMALSDCSPFALSQPATAVSEPDTPNRQVQGVSFRGRRDLLGRRRRRNSRKSKRLRGVIDHPASNRRCQPALGATEILTKEPPTDFIRKVRFWLSIYGSIYMKGNLETPFFA
jgi:hypothetical protein